MSCYSYLFRISSLRYYFLTLHAHKNIAFSIERSKFKWNTHLNVYLLHYSNKILWQICTWNRKQCIEQQSFEFAHILPYGNVILAKQMTIFSLQIWHKSIYIFHMEAIRINTSSYENIGWDRVRTYIQQASHILVHVVDFMVIKTHDSITFQTIRNQSNNFQSTLIACENEKKTTERQSVPVKIISLNIYSMLRRYHSKRYLIVARLNYTCKTLTFTW